MSVIIFSPQKNIDSGRSYKLRDEFANQFVEPAYGDIYDYFLWKPDFTLINYQKLMSNLDEMQAPIKITYLATGANKVWSWLEVWLLEDTRAENMEKWRFFQ